MKAFTFATLIDSPYITLEAETGGYVEYTVTAGYEINDPTQGRPVAGIRSYHSDPNHWYMAYSTGGGGSQEFHKSKHVDLAVYRVTKTQVE